jgi:predicted nucleotidyltransferase
MNHATLPTVVGSGELRALVEGELSRVQEICRRHNVLLLVLFGSTVTGRRHADSDLDLAALFEGPPGSDWYRREDALLNELEDALLPRCEVQLVALNRAPELLQKEIADTGVVLFSDAPDRWTLWRMRAYRAYEDTEKFRRRRWQKVLDEYGPTARPQAGS